MKKLLTALLTLMMLCGTHAWAAPVSYQQAKQTANSFMQAKQMVAPGKMKMAYKAPSATTQTDAASYYVFNNGDNDGFVIVSGDDRTTQVLGYSTTGSFSMADAPENVRAWLESYATAIANLDNMGVTEPMSGRRRIPSSTKVPTLMKTKWDQTEPYNDNCVFSGSSMATGCVATAMAQVLYYHRAESVTQIQADIPSYTSASYGFSVSGFSAGTAIDWDNMLTTYTSTSTAEQKAAVAQLMRLCGTAVKMDYGPQSGAFTFDVAGAMRKYFGYASTTTYVERKDYTSAEWEKLIFDEVASNRPVVYGGESTGGGHSFVIDGYDGNGLFSINWGWGGNSNGYFVLDICNPGDNSGVGASTTTDGYSMKQDAIIGAVPAQGGETSAVCLSAEITDTQYNYVGVTFFNVTGNTGTFEMGIAYLDASGNPVLIGSSEERTLQSYTISNNGSGASHGNYFQVTGLSAGTYTIVPVSRVKGSDTWVISGSHRIYVEAQVNSQGSATLTLVKPETDLTASGFSFTGTKTANLEQPFTVNVTNSGDEFYGTITCRASQGSAMPSTIASKTGATIATNASKQLEFTFTPTQQGTWNVWIADEDDNIFGKTTVVIDEEFVMEKNLEVSETVLNSNIKKSSSTYKTLGDNLNFTLTVTNNSANRFYGKISAVLWLSGSSEYMESKFTVDVPGNSSVEKQVKFGGLSYGANYYLNFYYDKETSSFDVGSYHYIPTQGITLWDSQGEKTEQFAEDATIVIPENAVAANVEGLTGKTITPNSNPNTLYYISDLSNVPSGLEGRNLVEDIVAENITITDGYDFYVPSDLLVEHISYTRTPQIGTNGEGGWETIALPFDVTSVKQGENSLEWFKARTEQDKNFWLMEFKNDDNGTVVFDYAQQMSANTPYIIAVPDNTWGEEWNLIGKAITFYGTDVELTRTSTMMSDNGNRFIFCGETVATDIPYYVGNYFYCLNNEGTRFALTQDAFTLQPFRALFCSDEEAGAKPEMLTIAFDNDKQESQDTDTDGASVVTAIAVPFVSEGHTVNIYSMSGVKVAQSTVRNGRIDFSRLPQGVYIVNGKKYIK